MPFPFVGSLISLKSAYGDSKVGVMATEALESSCDERIGLEANFEDMNSKGQLLASDTKPKLQFRKDISKAGWDVDLRMSEIIEKKGGMWTTMGIMRGSKLYCSIEETLFLAEIGALHLLDANDTTLSLKDIYEMVADRRNGCSWESFKAFRHLKSLGYIVGRHGVPWTLKNDKSCCKSTCPQETEESNIIPNSELQENAFINNHFRDMQISQLRPDFDVYLPNSKFKKSSPGNPDFVLCLARDPPSKAEIEGLERRCNGLPIKICNVEHGLVSFFSFNSVELPVLP